MVNNVLFNDIHSLGGQSAGFIYHIYQIGGFFYFFSLYIGDFLHHFIKYKKIY